MKRNKLLIMLLLLLLVGCKQLPPYAGKRDLIGNWRCQTIEITSPSNNIVNFAMRKFGFASFILDQDSLFSFSMDILRDVVVEKEVLGNNYSHTVIQAGYKNIRRGFYYATDSKIILRDANNDIVNEESYSFDERTLLTKFIDKDNKLWKISW